MVKVMAEALPSCLACNTCQHGTTQPGTARKMLKHQPGGGQSFTQVQAPLTPSQEDAAYGEIVLLA